MGQLFGGNKSQQTTQQTSSTEIDPRYSQFMEEGFGLASNIANTPYQPYTGPGPAGPNQQMNTAGALAEGMAIHGNPGVNNAVSNLGMVAGNIGPNFKPVDLQGKGQFQAPEIAQNAMQTNQVASSYQSPNIQQNAFQGPDINTMTADDYNQRIQARMDPYEDQVVQATMRDIEEQRQKQLSMDSASAVAANAFGGSRHGLVEAETNKSANQQAIDAAARLRSQGFGRAMDSVDAEQGRVQSLLMDRARAAASDTRAGEGLSLQDASTASGQALQADQMNIQQNIAAAGDQRTGEGLSMDAAKFDTQSAQNMLQMQLQQQGMSADDAARAAQQQIQAYQAQGNLAGMGGQQQLNAIGSLYNMGAGAMDAQTAQNMFQYQQYINQQNDPYRRLGAYTGMLGANVPTTTTTTSTGPQQRSNPFGAAMGGAASGASTGFMVGGPKGALIGGAIGGGLGLLSSQY